MCRSQWKLPFTKWFFSELNFYKSLLQGNKKRKKGGRIYLKPMVVGRDIFIPSVVRGRRLKIYNGRRLYTIRIRNLMLGHKCGEFSITKILGSKSHKKDKKSKKGKGKVVKKKIVVVKKKK